MITVAPPTLILIAAVAASAQTFDVASIRPHADAAQMGALSGRDFMPGGTRFAAPGKSLRYLLSEGYSLRMKQINGGPSWVDVDRWDVQAKVDRPAPTALMRVMLQNLLTERFRLKLQTTAKKMVLYRLTIAPGGPKLTESADGQPKAVAWGKKRDFQHFDAELKGFSMDDLVDALTTFEDGIGVNDTRLEGHYDIPVYYSHGAIGPDPRGETALPPAGPTIFDAAKKLGLRLDRVAGDTKILTVVHVEKPTPN
jgi:uncharacterized protein (TIGR03435 family)